MDDRMDSRMDSCAIGRRRLIGGLAACAALGALTALGARPARAQETDRISLDCDEVGFECEVSGLGSAELSLSFTVTSHTKGAISGVRVCLRPKGVDGFYLDDVTLDLDFSASPMLVGESRSGAVAVSLDETAASVECLSVSATGVSYPVWSGQGIYVIVLSEEHGDKSASLTLLVAPKRGTAEVDELVLHTSVYTADGSELGTPDIAVVGEGDTLRLDASAAMVEVTMGWRPEAARWRVTDADVSVRTDLGLSLETVEFGSYRQTSAGDFLPIEWYVLDERDGRKLLLSKYGLDCMPYNDERADVTWETCTLRAWLNSAFLAAAFTEEEISLVLEVELENDDNPVYGTPGGAVTLDRVFCLSLGEVESLFGKASWEVVRGELEDANVYYADLVCLPTDRTVERGVYGSSSAFGCFWWLRSPGVDAHCAAGVLADGTVNSYGHYVDSFAIAVRPAIWVSDL